MVVGCTAAPAAEIVLVFVGPTDSSAYKGARQGLEEAQAQGEFLGQHYTLTVQATSSPHPLQATAIIAATNEAGLYQLVTVNPGIAILNAELKDNKLRRTCRANLLHVLPSAEMEASALAQWRAANPQAKDVVARAWHPAFEKYAGIELNKRYQQAFNQPMDDTAWAAWAAVKLVSDMVAREQNADGTALLTALRDRLAFDGQKGVDLSFRRDGQLRQPILLVSGNKVVGEAPLHGAGESAGLDSLGRVGCEK